jgi:hypothetical protein
MVEVCALRDVAIAALQNPLVTLIGGIVAVGVAEKMDLIKEDWSAILRGGVVSVAVLQALQPVMKDLGWAGKAAALVAAGSAGGVMTFASGGKGTEAALADLLVAPGAGEWLTKIGNFLKSLNPF